MAANVETMFYTRTKPWNRWGMMIEKAPTSEEALELTSLNWQVIQKDRTLQRIRNRSGNVQVIEKIYLLRQWMAML